MTSRFSIGDELRPRVIFQIAWVCIVVSGPTVAYAGQPAAAADPQGATLGPLQQHGGHERDHDHQVEHDQDGLHR